MTIVHDFYPAVMFFLKKWVRKQRGFHFENVAENPKFEIMPAAVAQIVILQNKSYISMSMEANFHVLFLKNVLLS